MWPDTVPKNQSNPMLQVAMTPKGTSVRVLGCLSLLLMTTCGATVRPSILELILDSVQNIEDLVRDSYMHQPIYLISPAGRNEIVNSPYPLRPREVAINFDPSEEEIVREHLQRHPNSDKFGNALVGQSSINKKLNSNSNGNEYGRSSVNKDFPTKNAGVDEEPHYVAGFRSLRNNAAVDRVLGDDVINDRIQ